MSRVAMISSTSLTSLKLAMDILISSSITQALPGTCTHTPYRHHRTRRPPRTASRLLHSQDHLFHPSKPSKVHCGTLALPRILRRASPPTLPPCTIPRLPSWTSCIKETSGKNITVHTSYILVRAPSLCLCHTAPRKFYRCRRQGLSD